MTELREALLESLNRLAEAGTRADELLLAAETRIAAAPTADEEPLQALGALSREVWDAHKATQRAIRATYQVERLPASS